MAVSTYTLDEDAKILAAKQMGIPWTTLATEMGRSPGALSGRYKQMLVRATLGPPSDSPLRDPDDATVAERCEAHAAAILDASPRGFPALSEKRVGRGGIAACLPLIWPLDNL